MNPNNRFDELKTYLQTQGWQWKPGADVPHGEQIIVFAAGMKAIVNFWPKRGTFHLQGPDSPLKAALQGWLDEGTEAAAIPLPHLGLDEAGKGDWFGPLVVAGVYLDAEAGSALRRLGVRDSKALAGAALRRIAAQIERRLPEVGRRVRVIDPRTYNELYGQYNNVNRLLAEVYAEVAEQVWRATGAPAIVCDQFSRRTDRLAEAFAARDLPAPVQQHRAELVSLAVAAASILAVAAFDEALARLGRQAGLDRPLPKGASDLNALEAAARHILHRQGRQALGRYAKLNFKPVRKLLA
ncbi:MAG: ribonuclease HIII [Anaerolineae bacterium]